jgi:hypothetical protein
VASDIEENKAGKIAKEFLLNIGVREGLSE